MVVLVVVVLRNMSISRLDGFRIMRRCGVELYICVYLVYVFVDEFGVCSFDVVCD